MKKKILSVLVSIGLGVTTIGSVVQAANYPSGTEGESTVTATVTLGDGGGPDLPPIGPDFPDLPGIELPENPNSGELSLRYVSDFDFGDIAISAEIQSITILADVQKAYPMVTVQDYRGNDNRDGWHLIVSQEDDFFLPGAQIIMNPTVSSENADVLEVPQSGITLNNSGQLFVNTIKLNEKNGPIGIFSIGMGTKESGVELVVPANTPVGKYSTTLKWNLASGPLDNEETSS